MLLIILLISNIVLAACLALPFAKRLIKVNTAFWLILLFFSFIPVGLFFILSQSDEISKGFVRQSWPSVTAEIIETTIIGERAYSPQITCEYTVSGKNYILKTDLHTPGFGRKKSRQQTSRIIIAQYSVGSEIKVFYNPENPSDSLVRTGPYFNNYLILTLGYLLLGAGLTMMIALLGRTWHMYPG